MELAGSWSRGAFPGGDGGIQSILKG
ncbi:unnamed protein product, partial [Rotaria sp. Silwood1]